MPAQKPGKSKQTYGTPRVLLDAVERRFGELQFDLAASRDNAVVRGSNAGNFFTERNNSLVQEWHKLGGNLWLNPPFANIDDWAEKCMVEAEKGARIIMLTPASVGSEWFRHYVHNRALVLALNPRVTFVGETMPYPKDCMLSVFAFGVRGFDVWRWR